MATFRAGAAEEDLTPALGVELMGYGARTDAARGVHDHLHARGLYLEQTGPPGQGRAAPGVLLVSAELCLIGVEQARRLREQLSRATGVGAERILVSCTHTHSGPESGLGPAAAGLDPPAHVGDLEAAILRAGERAVAAARPARLDWGSARAEIGRNRRIADGPLDPQVLAWRIDADDGPVAVLFHHGCHPTVLGHDNLEISADWPGVTCRALRERYGGVPFFLLGAHADVDPRTRGLMDLAIPGQSVGLGHRAVQVLGLEVADAVDEALATARPSETPLGFAHASLDLPLQLGDLPPAAARSALEARRHEIAELYGWALEDFPRLRELHARAHEGLAELRPDEARKRISRVQSYVRDKTAPFLVGGARTVRVELAVLRLGGACLLGLPLEATTAVGLDWKRRASRFPAAGVSSITNGWLRYLPHPDDLAHPRAEEHYEVLNAVLAPGAAEGLLDRAASLLDRVQS